MLPMPDIQGQCQYKLMMMIIIMTVFYVYTVAFRLFCYFINIIIRESANEEEEQRGFQAFNCVKVDFTLPNLCSRCVQLFVRKVNVKTSTSGPQPSMKLYLMSKHLNFYLICGF